MTRKIQRKIALSLICAMTLQVTSAFAGAKTNTTLDNYANYLKQNNITQNNANYFVSNKAVNVEEFVVMVVKAIDPQSRNLKAGAGQAYYEPFFKRALELGLVREKDYDEVPQMVGWMLPRELALNIVNRALVLQGDKTVINTALGSKIKDFEIVNDGNKESVLKAYQLGFFKSFNGSIKSPLTRDEGVYIITKLMDSSKRDKVNMSLNISKNMNTDKYNPVVKWTLDEFQKQVTKKTVSIEKKANGVKNAGDVDYTERAFYLNGKWHNWWTDQEFEDLTTGKADNKTELYANSPSLPNMMEFADLKSVSGGFMPIDGELLFINIDGVLNGKAEKLYNEKMKNFNRIWYDLTKYTTQYAKLSGFYCTSNILGDHSYIMFSEAESDTSKFGSLVIYRDPIYTKNLYGYIYAPHVSIDMINDYVAKRDKALYEQWFVRLYGEYDGKALFKIAYDWTKGKSSTTHHKTVLKTYKGYSIQLLDGYGQHPTIEILYK